MNQMGGRTLGLAAIMLLICSGAIHCDRQSKRINGAERRNNSTSTFTSTCGDAREVSRQIGVCVQVIFDLIEGKIPDPNVDADIVRVCDSFYESEKCVRQVAKGCLKGIHKSATGTVATAVRKYRLQECKSEKSRAKYFEPFKCANRKAVEMTQTFKNVTSMAQGVRDMKGIAPEDKIMRICCLMGELDRTIKGTYNRDCPESTPVVMGILNALTEDVRALLCRSAKCNNFNPHLKYDYKQNQNLIEPMMEILFMLTTE